MMYSNYPEKWAKKIFLSVKGLMAGNDGGCQEQPTKNPAKCSLELFFFHGGLNLQKITFFPISRYVYATYSKSTSGKNSFSSNSPSNSLFEFQSSIYSQSATSSNVQAYFSTIHGKPTFRVGLKVHSLISNYNSVIYRPETVQDLKKKKNM